MFAHCKLTLEIMLAEVPGSPGTSDLSTNQVPGTRLTFHIPDSLSSPSNLDPSASSLHGGESEEEEEEGTGSLAKRYPLPARQCRPAPDSAEEPGKREQELRQGTLCNSSEKGIHVLGSMVTLMSLYL